MKFKVDLGLQGKAYTFLQAMIKCINNKASYLQLLFFYWIGFSCVCVELVCVCVVSIKLGWKEILLRKQERILFPTIHPNTFPVICAIWFSDL